MSKAISGLKGFPLHFQGFRLSENGGAGASRRHAVDVQRACGERAGHVQLLLQASLAALVNVEAVKGDWPSEILGF